MPSGQEIIPCCTLGDSHKRERAVLCAGSACRFFSRYVTLTRGDTDLYGVRTVLTSVAMYGTIQADITRASRRIEVAELASYSQFTNVLTSLYSSRKQRSAGHI